MFERFGELGSGWGDVVLHSRKLDESRATEAAPPSAEEPEPEPEAQQESLEERRARVHAKAQEAIDAMQEPLP